MFSDFDVRTHEIRGRFIKRAVSEETRLKTLVAQPGEHSPEPVIEELYQLGHWFAGSAGTFGFGELSYLGDSVEKEADALRSSGKTDSYKLAAVCNRLLGAIHALSGQQDNK